MGQACMAGKPEICREELGICESRGQDCECGSRFVCGDGFPRSFCPLGLCMMTWGVPKGMGNCRYSRAME